MADKTIGGRPTVPPAPRGVRAVLGSLGPGLIAGASDNDPTRIKLRNEQGRSFGIIRV